MQSQMTVENHDIMRQDNEIRELKENVCPTTLGELVIFKESQPHVVADICQTTCHLTRIK